MRDVKGGIDGSFFFDGDMYIVLRPQHIQE